MNFIPFKVVLIFFLGNSSISKIKSSFKKTKKVLCFLFGNILKICIKTVKKVLEQIKFSQSKLLTFNVSKKRNCRREKSPFINLLFFQYKKFKIDFFI